MEESQRSETVAVLADMSEPLASGTEEQQNINKQHQRRAAQQVVIATTSAAAAAASVRAAATTTVTTAAGIHPVAVATNVAAAAAGLPAGVGVPVSLPVGSIIGATLAGNGTTFNVITSDQLQVRVRDRDAYCGEILIPSAVACLHSRVDILIFSLGLLAVFF